MVLEILKLAEVDGQPYLKGDHIVQTWLVKLSIYYHNADLA